MPALRCRLIYITATLPTLQLHQAFPGYAAQFTSKSAAKLVLKDCGKIEVSAINRCSEIRAVK
jgi:hypothetical protein